MSETKEFPKDGLDGFSEFMTGANDPTTIRQLCQYLLNRSEARRLKEQGDYATLLRAEHDLIMTPINTESVKIELNTRLLAVRPDEGYIAEPSGETRFIKQLRVFPLEEGQ